MKTTAQFIEEAREIHGNKYDYSKTEYVGSKKKICIICPKHGEFFQEANSHLKGSGCPTCFKEKNGDSTRFTFEKFIKKAKELYQNKYEYDKTTFIDKYCKMKIVCPIHGKFLQSPRMHLRGSGCPKCSRTTKYTTERWINIAKQIHGNKYDYTKIQYVNPMTKVCIICPTHGEFWQYPNNHLKGCGCKKCKLRDTTEGFIDKAKQIHDNTYDYSKVEYTNSRTKICIICPIHGEFWIKPNDHLNGQGCPKCKASTLERTIRDMLIENNIDFEEQKTFDWLKFNGKLKLDFYLPQYNIAIECQGAQHFEDVPHFNSNGNDVLKTRKERDERKRKLCKENGIKLLYYSNLGIDYPYEVFEDKGKLIEEIRSTT